MDYHKTFFFVRMFAGISFCVLLLIFFSWVYGWIRDPEAEVLSLTADSDQPPIAGSFMNYQMVVRMPWFRRPLPPLYLELYDQDAAVIAIAPAGVKKVGPGYWDWHVKAVIQAYRPGQFSGGNMTLPLLPRRAGDDYILRQAIPDFYIASTLADEGEARISPAPVWSSRKNLSVRRSPRPWFFILLAASAAVAGASFVLSRRGYLAGPGHLAFCPRQELLRLIGERSLNRGPGDELFFLHLADFIKKYSGQLFGVPAEGKTSEELLQALRQEQLLTSSHLSLWERFFIFTDRVKFAGDQVSPEEIDSMLDRLRALITEGEVCKD